MTEPAPPPPKRFFLAPPVDERAPRLLAGEAEHARRVLRLGPGDELLGLDGRGLLLPCRIEEARGVELSLAPAGPARHEPAPGEPGAPLPWIEVAVAWPRPARAPEMLDRLTQLGAAGILPLAARRSGQRGQPRPERLVRVLREACKQSRRSHLPELAGEAVSPLELPALRPGATLVLLDPGTGLPLDTFARALCTDGSWLATRERPLVLCVGPEGGFEPDEESALLAAGATAVRVGPHVLRIETAAEAALAILAGVLAA